MKYKKLGNTGLLVSELCLGTMTFGSKEDFKRVRYVGELQQNEANEIIEAALNGGINFIDTSNNYSGGESEKIIGQALKDLQINRENVVIATKVCGQVGHGPNDSGLSRQHIFSQVKRSLKNMQIDYIDLYQAHLFDTLTPLEETLSAFNDLVREGLVRYIGCSNFYAWQLMKANAISDKYNYPRFETLQSYYSLASRELEREIVPALQDQNMGLLVWSPLAGGLLSGKYKKGQNNPEGSRWTTSDYNNFLPVDIEKVYRIIDVSEDIANDKGVSVAQVALSWLLAQPCVTSIILGVRNSIQLNDNLQCTSISLTQSDLEKLNEVSKIPLEYPAWIPGASRNRYLD